MFLASLAQVITCIIFCIKFWSMSLQVLDSYIHDIPTCSDRSPTICTKTPETRRPSASTQFWNVTDIDTSTISNISQKIIWKVTNYYRNGFCVLQTHYHDFTVQWTHCQISNTKYTQCNSTAGTRKMRGNTCLKLSFSPSLVLKKTIIYFTLDLPSIMVALYKFIFTCNNHKAAK